MYYNSSLEESSYSKNYNSSLEESSYSKNYNSSLEESSYSKNNNSSLERAYIESYRKLNDKVFNDICHNSFMNDYNTNVRNIDSWERDFYLIKEKKISYDVVTRCIEHKNISYLKYLINYKGKEIITKSDIKLANKKHWEDGYKYLSDLFDK